MTLFKQLLICTQCSQTNEQQHQQAKLGVAVGGCGRAMQTGRETNNLVCLALYRAS